MSERTEKRFSTKHSTYSLLIGAAVFLLLGCEEAGEQSDPKGLRYDPLAGPSEEWVRNHEKKCSDGDLKSCFNLGHYWRGDSYPRETKRWKQDLEKARSYFESACLSKDKKGRARLAACYWLAEMKRSGEGGDRNADEAIRLFKETCDLGYGLGCMDLGIELYTIQNDLQKGRALFRKACEMKTFQACSGYSRRIRLGDKKRWEVIQILQGTKEPNSVLPEPSSLATTPKQ